MGKSNTDKIVRITKEAHSKLREYGDNEGDLKKVVSEIILDYINLLDSLVKEKREAYNLGYNNGYSEGYKAKEEGRKKVDLAFSKPGDRF